jgi:hypothetical protein
MFQGSMLKIVSRPSLVSFVEILVFITLIFCQSHEIDYKKCTELGLSKGRGWLLNFLGAPIPPNRNWSIIVL